MCVCVCVCVCVFSYAGTLKIDKWQYDCMNINLLNHLTENWGDHVTVKFPKGRRGGPSVSQSELLLQQY